MKLVHQAVNHRREQQSCDDEKYTSGVQCEQSREDLAAVAPERIDRAHATEQHGGVQECVAPGQMLVMLVARHPAEQRDEDQCSGHGEMTTHAPRESFARYRLGEAVFVNHDRARFPLRISANRALTSFLIRVIGIGRASGSRTVPLAVSYPLRSRASRRRMALVIGKRLQWLVNAAYQTRSLPSSRNAGMP